VGWGGGGCGWGGGGGGGGAGGGGGGGGREKDIETDRQIELESLYLLLARSEREIVHHTLTISLSTEGERKRERESLKYHKPPQKDHPLPPPRHVPPPPPPPPPPLDRWKPAKDGAKGKRRKSPPRFWGSQLAPRLKMRQENQGRQGGQGAGEGEAKTTAALCLAEGQLKREGGARQLRVQRGVSSLPPHPEGSPRKE